jgi:hypothetical protein
LLFLEEGKQAGVSQRVDLSDGGVGTAGLASSRFLRDERPPIGLIKMVMTTRLIFLVCNMCVSPIWERRLNVWVFQ